MTNLDIPNMINLLGSLITSYGLKVIGAILFLIVGRIAAGWARKGTKRALERGEIDATLIPFLSGILLAACRLRGLFLNLSRLIPSLVGDGRGHHHFFGITGLLSRICLCYVAGACQHT